MNQFTFIGATANTSCPVGPMVPCPYWRSRRQKNDTEESIPLIPGFEELLLETPEAEQFGWTFNPMEVAGTARSTGEVSAAECGMGWQSHLPHR